MYTQVKKVLLIDDDKDDRNLFAEALKMVDPSIEFMHAFDGAVALELLSDHLDALPDYIFLDLNMPRMNGKECLQELKRDGKLSNVPVIIFSTSKSEADIMETKNLGASYFATKPIDFFDLIEEIRFVLCSQAPASGLYVKSMVEVF